VLSGWAWAAHHAPPKESHCLPKPGRPSWS